MVTTGTTKGCAASKTESLCSALCNKKFFILLAALGSIALIKVFIIVYFQIDLHSEEAQYWVWSKNMQFSYYSKPPLIAYLNWLSTSIFGDTLLGIRINGILIGFFVSLVSYFFAWELFKDINTAILASMATCVFPFQVSISAYFLTDTPLLLFCLCAMFFFWKALESRKRLWWILFGLSVGFGLLSKYAMFMLLVPMCLFAWRHHRDVFRTKYFYLSLLIGLVMFFPVICWNINQGGVGALHVVNLSGANNQQHSGVAVVSNIFVFALGQLAILLPFYQYRQLFRKIGGKRLTKEEEFLLLPAISIFLVFVVVSALRESEAYINWAMFAYMGIPLVFARWISDEKKIKAGLRIVALMGFVWLLFAGLSSSGNKLLALGKYSPVRKVIGWSQLAEKVDALKETIPAGKSYVFSTNYHITSEMWFYLKGQAPTYYLNLNSRMTQYDLWPGIEQFVNTDKIGLYVSREKISSQVQDGFSALLKADSCQIYYQGSFVDTYYIYLLQGQKGFRKQHSSH
ncbi:MAG: glycosyltransferase family 39 protein [Prolixibacteraceae bacterium]|nr:glycosyltransferase family 39 protein [Prolixibacteraceae bacterium]